jgi:hypothetical protein
MTNVFFSITPPPFLKKENPTFIEKVPGLKGLPLAFEQKKPGPASSETRLFIPSSLHAVQVSIYTSANLVKKRGFVKKIMELNEAEFRSFPHMPVD